MVTERELQTVEIRRVSGHHKKIGSDVVILEDTVLLRTNGESCKSFCCLPMHLEDMARGYLVSEGLCRPTDIKGIEVRSEGGKLKVDATIQRRSARLNEIKSEIKISIAGIWEAVSRLREQAILHQKTGSTHIAGLFSNGSNPVFAEDISRHCSIDKAIGLALQNRFDLTTAVLVTSCRQTESTITKAIHSQIPIVVSIVAVTTLAIDNAQKYGITLIGFAKRRGFQIYAHQERIIDGV